MHNGDVLGDEGRKALNACVKVKIYGKPKTRRYDREATLWRLRGCYASSVFYPWGIQWLCTDQLTLPKGLRYVDHTKSEKTTYNIVDIHDALVNCDEKSYVDKYPKEGPGSEKLRALIDKRREDIEREYKEARNNPEERLKYPWIVAQRRVRDCFVGLFPGDSLAITLKYRLDPYNIKDVHDAVVEWNEKLFCTGWSLPFHDQKITLEKRGEEKRMKTLEDIKKQRAAIEKEYKEAINSAGINQKYSQSEAEQRVEGCYFGTFPPGVVILPVKLDGSGTSTQKYDILDICKALHHFDEKKVLDKYPDEGPGSAELRKLIDECRDELENEYKMATCSTEGEQVLREYSIFEAERRVRDCFAGTFFNDTDMFPTKKDQSGIPKFSQAYDIFDIKEALDYFDAKKFCEKHPEEGGAEYDRIKQSVDEQRDGIQREYERATTDIEIENGSGFIVQEHFIITNRHVIEETYLNETGRYKILISNAAVNDRPCTVAHYDVGKDLALLYCPNLNLEQYGICPLQLSNQSLLPGMPIVCFGYPMSHTGKTALFVSGNVSGYKDTPQGHSMVVLNCSLNSGNSGGPVLHWINGKLKVVGVATQKHFKQILTFEERQTIENIRESLQTRAISDVPDYIKESNKPVSDYYLDPQTHQTPVTLLTLKLYDALETHSQFNLSNAVPGHLVVEFVKNSISEYEGKLKEELFKVVELANNVVNTS